jgi:hypothetical protein
MGFGLYKGLKHMISHHSRSRRVRHIHCDWNKPTNTRLEGLGSLQQGMAHALWTWEIPGFGPLAYGSGFCDL